MKLSHYKKTRVIISVFFFCITIALFLDFRNLIPTEITKRALYLQFIPSLIKFVSFAGIGTAGFLIILALSVLFGRLYCSSICPMGTLQDFFARLSSRFKRKKKYIYKKPHNILRYSILGITIVFYLSGSVFLLNLLDPYSNFGKISSVLFRPIIIKANNLIAISLEKTNLYWLSPYEFHGITSPTLVYAAIFLFIVFFLSFRYGRLYCNTICPVGALLSLFSKFSLFKIAIDKDNCKSCGVCEKNCKSNCIDFNNKEIDFTRCVSCYNCFSVCPTGGIKYIKNNFKKSLAKEVKQETDIGKREFVFKSLVYLAGLSSISFAKQEVSPKDKNAILKKLVVSPPGSKSVKHFNDSCTACHLCVSSCPTQVLQPSYLEYGFLNMLQPRMDYNKSFCNYECNICSKICPTGAISQLPLEQKKTTQIGHAIFIADNCVVHTDDTDCGACSEHCPTKAVLMVPYKNGLFTPAVNKTICIGCGACEYACPAEPHKAIFVDGNPVHKKAKKPEVEKLDQKVQEDFPF